MGLKKGIYFTFDSFIAGGIVVLVILLASSLYVKEQDRIDLNFLSRDLVTVLGTITVEEIDNDYINSLISGGSIENLENTVLEQIVVFWENNELEKANKTAANVIEPWVINKSGVGLWIDNQTIYTRDVPIEKFLVSSKKIIGGIKGDPTRQNPPELLGPVIVEIRVWE